MNIIHLNKINYLITYYYFLFRFFESQPIIVDSLHFSPQRRKRYFWSNLMGVAEMAYVQKMDNYDIDEPKLEDYLEKILDRQANVEKVGTITSKRSCLQDSMLLIYEIPNTIYYYYFKINKFIF